MLNWYGRQNYCQLKEPSIQTNFSKLILTSRINIIDVIFTHLSVEEI
jgi:hypothetical protein